MQTKVSRRDMRSLVQRRAEFKGSNVFAQWETLNRAQPDEFGDHPRVYVVYSYGVHWPLFVYVPTIGWLENTSKYGTTTSCHHSACHPHGATIKLDKDQLVDVLDRLRRGEPFVSIALEGVTG